MKHKYYREKDANYVVFPVEVESISTYRKKMVLTQRWENLLPCNLRVMNGKEQLLFDCTGCICLSWKKQGSGWGIDQIKMLFSGLKKAYGELDRFLLPWEGLEIDPELIFYDFCRDRFLFLYVPKEKEEENSWIPLLEFLLEHLNNEDEEAVDFLYRSYELAESGAFSFRIAEGLLASVSEKGAGESGMQQEEEERIQGRPADVGYYEPEGVECGTEYTGYGPDNEDMWGITSEKEETSDEDVSSCRAKGTVWFILLVGSVIGVGGMLVGYSRFVLSDSEQIIFLSAFSALCALAVISAILGVVGIIRRKKSANIEERAEILKGGVEGTVEYGREDVSGKRMQGIQLEELLIHANQSPRYCPTIPGQVEETGERGERKDTEHTVLFEEQRKVEDSFLYAVSRKNKKHIPLSKLPLVIGKDPDQSDICIEHGSISRVHARLSLEDGELKVTDLGSTNGTLVNGIRIAPTEPFVLEPEDEIRFGSICYIYR